MNDYTIFNNRGQEKKLSLTNSATKKIKCLSSFCTTQTHNTHDFDKKHLEKRSLNEKCLF